MSLRNDYILQRMAQRQIPGLAVRVAREGCPAFEKEWGCADIVKNTPVSSTTSFRIGCLTKPVIAVTVLLLAKDGLLDLDDKIVKYLPAMVKNTRPYFAEITISQLLIHRSGLARGTYAEEVIDTEKQLQEITKSTLAFTPGTDYKYSNWGYVLLGRIIEKVTGIPATQYCTERILDPLGMKGTFFQTDKDMNNLATGYWDKWHFGYPDLSVPIQVSKWFPIAPCASGLISTPDDFLKFMNALFDDSIAVISPGVRAQLFTKTGNKTATKFTSLGLYGEVINGREVWYFPGTNSGFSAYCFYIPTLKTSGAAMANRTACNNELKEILQFIITDTWPNVQAPVLNEDPLPFAGAFTNTCGEKLDLKLNTEGESQLNFRDKVVSLQLCTTLNYFQINGNNRQHMLRLHTLKGMVFEVTRGNESFRSESKKKRSAEKGETLLEAYTGTYEYPAFGRAEVLLRNSKLYLDYGIIYETPLISAGTHKFQQKKGPFMGEEVEFAPAAGNGQYSPYFLLNNMKFHRLIHQ